jgi:hypothetical protein
MDWFENIKLLVLAAAYGGTRQLQFQKHVVFFILSFI